MAEACPLRWAFSRATYADGSRGFPERPGEAALRGTVVHRAVDEVLSALADAGCASVDAPEAARVLLGLGGVSAVVARHVEAVLAELPTHARAARVASALARAIRDAAPALRDQVGPFVRRARLRPRAPRRMAALPGETDGSPGTSRAPLGQGSHAEVWVECDQPPFVGQIDLLTLGSAAIEIADVKTGRPSPAHADQLVTYGVLWSRDRDLNPAGRLPTALSILYLGETVTVPLVDWVAAADALTARATAAAAALVSDPVPASPSRDTCRWCPARPACPAYWASTFPPERSSAGAQFLDVDLDVLEEISPDLWSTTITACPSDADRRGPATLIARQGATLAPDQHLRILGARVMEGDTVTEGMVITISPSTEVFVVEPTARS